MSFLSGFGKVAEVNSINTEYQWLALPVSLGQVLERASKNFELSELYFGHGTDNPWDEAVQIAIHVLGLKLDTDASVLERQLTQTELDDLFRLFKRRINERVPVAYLTGLAYFSGFEFIVNADVLVPRSPISELIENAYSPWLRKDPRKILDLCTGSGCIGIATAHVFPDAEVDISDLSKAAIKVAEQNIKKHGLESRVNAIESDLFSAMQGRRYDLIVCNPPYVNAEDLAAMPAEFHAEPVLGLASGADGLDFCKRLLAEASDHLTEDGCLIVELGNTWQTLDEQFQQVPFVWLEFERGGHGVFVLSAEDLAAHRGLFLK